MKGSGIAELKPALVAIRRNVTRIQGLIGDVASLDLPSRSSDWMPQNRASKEASS